MLIYRRKVIHETAAKIHGFDYTFSCSLQGGVLPFWPKNTSSSPAFSKSTRLYRSSLCGFFTNLPLNNIKYGFEFRLSFFLSLIVWLHIYSQCWWACGVSRVNVKVFPASGLLFDSNSKINYDMQVLSWISVCHIKHVTVIIPGERILRPFPVLSFKELKMSISDFNYCVWCITAVSITRRCDYIKR